MKRLKLFPKTFLYVSGLMLIITFIAHALIYYLMPIYYTNQKRDTFKRETDALVELLSSLPEEDYKSEISKFREGSDMMVMLFVGRKDGKEIWQIYSNNPEENGKEIEFFINSDNNGTSINMTMDRENLVVEKTFSNHQKDTYKLKTYLPLEPVREASNVVLTLLPMTLIICTIISAIFAFIYSRAITKPITKISSVARHMKQFDKEAVCLVTSRDEIGTLAEDLNSLYGHLLSAIDRLECEISEVSKSEQSKADFLRTASHELKTPVTAVSAMLEGMIHKVGRYKDRDTYLHECKKQIDDLGVLLREILEATKLDMFSEVEHSDTVDLCLMMERVIEPYRLIAMSKQVNVIYKKADSFIAKLPERLFSKAVSNVISNAVNYTASGKSVHIYFKGRNIIVENECIPIHDNVLMHLSEPFYRLDLDHNHETGGNGLGLYITDKVFSACGISYTFEPMESKKGMRFTIRL